MHGVGANQGDITQRTVEDLLVLGQPFKHDHTQASRSNSITSQQSRPPPPPLAGYGWHAQAAIGPPTGPARPKSLERSLPEQCYGLGKSDTDHFQIRAPGHPSIIRPQTRLRAGGCQAASGGGPCPEPRDSRRILWGQRPPQSRSGLAVEHKERLCGRQ